MEKMSKEDFKKAVVAAFESKGYSKIRLSMALFGMQCDVHYSTGGLFGHRKAKVYLKEKNGTRYLDVQQEDGIDWKYPIPDDF